MKMGIMSIFRKIKERFVNWLLGDVVIEKLKVLEIESGKSSIKVTGDYIDLSPLTGDPALSAGRVWFRSDLGGLRYSPDGSKIFDVRSDTLIPLVFDDTQKSVVGTTETEVKYFRFSKTGSIRRDKLIVIASLWVSGGTGSLKIYIDDESSPRLTLQTTSTTETIVSGEIDISDLANGIHTIHIKLVNNTAGQTTYNELIEVYAK